MLRGFSGSGKGTLPLILEEVRPKARVAVSLNSENELKPTKRSLGARATARLHDAYDGAQSD